MSLIAYRVYYRKWPNLDMVRNKINDAFVISMNSKVISKGTLTHIDKVAHKVHTLMDNVRKECQSDSSPPYYDSINMKWDRLK